MQIAPACGIWQPAINLKFSDIRLNLITIFAADNFGKDSIEPLAGIDTALASLPVHQTNGGHTVDFEQVLTLPLNIIAVKQAVDSAVNIEPDRRSVGDVSNIVIVSATNCVAVSRNDPVVILPVCRSNDVLNQQSIFDNRHELVYKQFISDRRYSSFFRYFFNIVVVKSQEGILFIANDNFIGNCFQAASPLCQRQLAGYPQFIIINICHDML